MSSIFIQGPEGAAYQCSGCDAMSEALDDLTRESIKRRVYVRPSLRRALGALDTTLDEHGAGR